MSNESKSVEAMICQAVAKEIDARAVMLVIIHKEAVGPNGSNTELALGITDPVITMESMMEKVEGILSKTRADMQAKKESGENALSA